jgi:hypothetical protein
MVRVRFGLATESRALLGNAVLGGRGGSGLFHHGPGFAVVETRTSDRDFTNGADFVCEFAGLIHLSHGTDRAGGVQGGAKSVSWTNRSLSTALEERAKG